MKYFLPGLTLLFLTAQTLLAQHQTYTRKQGTFSPTDKIHAFFFDDKSSQLRVIDETNRAAPAYGSLEKAMQHRKCTAGINGGYFGADDAGTPLGMVVQDRKTIHPLQSGAFSVSGLIYDTGKQLQLVRSKEFLGRKNKPAIANAIQGGPFLIEKGKIVPGLNNSRHAYRTFIATDGKGKWCIATTTSLTLQELAEWLHTKGSVGNFTVQSALNLDGGSSSAYWVHSPRIYYPSVKRVRNYIGISPR